MTPELADKIMTRIIARVEADGGVLHKSSGIEEIIGTCAVAVPGAHTFTPLDMGDDRVETPMSGIHIWVDGQWKKVF